MKTRASYFRNMIFGAEDSLVSTVGVLFGVASTAYDSKLIVITGLIVIVVEATSMGAGAFLSETSAQEYENDAEEHSPIKDGIIMCLSYFFAGFIPLIPYIIFPAELAKFSSIAASIIALFFLGYLPYKSIKAGMRMSIVAGIAILLGFLIGSISNTYI